MLDSKIGTTILNGLFCTSGKATNIAFSGDLYLGLLTKLPKDNGDAYDDGKYFEEPADPTYLRIKITTESRINHKNFIAHAVADDPVIIDGGTAIPASVTNQSIIMFPESSVYWGEVVGFGLFSEEDSSSDSLPVLWGEITSSDGDSPLIIGQYEVPVIREGRFKVSLV